MISRFFIIAFAICMEANCKAVVLEEDIPVAFFIIIIRSAVTNRHSLSRKGDTKALQIVKKFSIHNFGQFRENLTRACGVFFQTLLIDSKHVFAPALGSIKGQVRIVIKMGKGVRVRT